MPKIVTLGPPRRTAVPAIEKPEGLAVKTWPPTV